MSSSMTSKEELEFWKREFCPKMGLRPNGTLMVTVQKGRTGEYFSRIVDFDGDAFHSVYPQAELSQACTQRRFGELLVCYYAGLSSATFKSLKRIRPIHETINHRPFCCSEIQSYKSIRIDWFESIFSNLLLGTAGHHPDIVLEIIRQVNNGPKIKTTYWTMKNNILEELLPFSDGVVQRFQKKDAFKNYTCSRHDLFFGVNLLSRDTLRNSHHMRLYNFARDNDELLKEFREAVKTQMPQMGLC